MTGKIFISYRRESDAANALSIGQYLEQEFGRQNVFIDVDMRAGAKFPSVLEERLKACKVMLALLGPDWINATDASGQRRLDNPNDWVRLEIGRALARDITVIPVRVGGADLPDRDKLPTDIQGLLDYQAATVTTSSFRNDMAGLARDIRKIPNSTNVGSARLLITAVLLVFSLSGFGAYKAGLFDWVRSRLVNENSNVVFGTDWILSGFLPNGYAFYFEPASLKEFADRVAVKTRQTLDPSIPAYQGKIDNEVSYEEDVSVYSCNSLSFGIAEVTVIGKNGDVRFHYKMEDPKYIDLTRLTPIKPGSIAENMQHIVCDKELRLPLLTKADLLSMNFTYLISTPNADGEIYYGSNKASPGKGAKLLITRLRDDQSLNGLAVNGSRVVSKLNNYRTIVSSLDVDCPAARINLVKTEYYDKNGDLRAMFDDRSTYDVAQGSTFDQLRRAICGNAKS